MSDLDKPDLTTLTVDLLAAYFANNVVPSEDLASLIQSTHGALAATANGPVEEAPAEQVYTPAVSIKKSLASPDHLISLIDGKSYKTLKRHLAKHGLTIAEYKERYKLPASYPSVAPSYSEARRQTATRLGLGGRKSNAAKAEQAAAAASAEGKPETAKPKSVRAKPAKAAPSGDGAAKPVKKPRAKLRISAPDA